MGEAKKILVTGGAGYIGSHTVITLKAGFEPIIIDNFVNSSKHMVRSMEAIIGGPVTLYEGDCQDSALLDTIFKTEGTIDAVIHFAALKSVGDSVKEPVRYYQTNNNALLAVLEAMERWQAHNIVFSSSCTVYGMPDSLPLTEQSPVKPAVMPYAHTKQMGEQMLRLTSWCHTQNPTDYHLNALSLRYFNPVGAHPSATIGELPSGVPSNLIPFLTQAAVGKLKTLSVFGNDYETRDGTCIRDYIHVLDVAEAHVKAIEYLLGKPEKGYYDVFNIGTGTGSTVFELIHAFEQANNLPINYTVGPRRPGDVPAYYANATKANEVLHWKHKRTVQQAMKDAWQWQQYYIENEQAFAD